MTEADIEFFLTSQPGIHLVPSRGVDYQFIGNYAIKAKHNDGKIVEEQYRLRIIVPYQFPKTIPSVWEIGSQIPNNGQWHINPNDGSICLGSYLRLLLLSRDHPVLSDYLDHCLVPYLYAVTIRKKFGGDFYFHDLAHGKNGLIDDAQELFGLQEKASAVLVIKLLAMKRRVANRHICPCGCRNPLGRCDFVQKLAGFRRLAPRSFYKHYVRMMVSNE